MKSKVATMVFIMAAILVLPVFSQNCSDPPEAPDNTVLEDTSQRSVSNIVSRDNSACVYLCLNLSYLDLYVHVYKCLHMLSLVCSCLHMSVLVSTCLY